LFSEHSGDPRLSELKKHDEVRFSESFFPSEPDGVQEASLTEAGAMTNPEFLMRFRVIRKD